MKKCFQVSAKEHSNNHTHFSNKLFRYYVHDYTESRFDSVPTFRQIFSIPKNISRVSYVIYHAFQFTINIYD
jgi:hypothetical protein